MPHRPDTLASRRARSRPLAAAAVVVSAILAGLLPPSPAAAALRVQGDASAPVVLLGMPGLRWDDLDPQVTPSLWALAEGGSLAAMSVRSVRGATCPADGWLTVSAGRRAAAPHPQAAAGDVPEEEAAPYCPTVLTPEGAGEGAGARLIHFPDYVEHNDELRYDARVGLLGEALAAGGVCATAVGPGAALAVADRHGVVPRYVPGGSLPTPQTFAACPLTVVDLGGMTNPGFTTFDEVAPREQQAMALDERVGQIRDAAPPDAVVLVAALADSSRAPHLSVTIASGGAYDDQWLQSRSTRRVGLVQLTDVTPTVLSLLGLPRPGGAVGSPMTPTGQHGPVAGAVEVLVDLDTAAQVVRDLTPHFFTFLIVSQLVLYGAAAVALRRQWGGPASRLRVLRATRYAALAFAAVPVSTFLANVVPWWQQDHALAALVLAVVLGIAAVTAFAVLGPWRRRILGPFGAVAAVTAVVLGVDVMTGSRLQLSSLMGYSPLVAGRFYGFGNVAFALFAAGAILAVAGCAEPLLRQGRRGAATLLAVVTGVVAVAVDGSPRWGSDFGGVLALVPGFAVLAMALAGIRVTLLRFAAAMAGAVVTISAIAVLDWLGPAQDRAHLGRFVQQVLDGEAVTVVQRKLAANYEILTTSWLGILVPFATAFLVFVLMRPLQWRAAALKRAYDRAPTLRPGLGGTAVALIVGFAVNDSGIAIPAVGLTVAIPLTLAASVTALERDEVEGAPADHRGGAAPIRSPGAAGAARSRA